MHEYVLLIIGDVIWIGENQQLSTAYWTSLDAGSAVEAPR